MSKKNSKVQSFQEILDQVKTSIAETANENAIQIVVDKMVNEEVDKRAELIERATELWVKTRSELNKCVPDVVTHVAATAGEDESETFVKEARYSETKMKERNALREKLSNIQAALILALGEKQDYNKLSSLVGKK